MRRTLGLVAALTASVAANAAVTETNGTEITYIGGTEQANRITEDTVWTSENTYILDRIVYITDGATLTIEPGTVVKAELGTAANVSALVIGRGSKIFAVGTPSDPIIFTSIDDPMDNSMDDFDTGLWGGLVVLSDGLLNSDKAKKGQVYPNITDNVEGITVNPYTEFGGTDNNSSSGIIRYVQIRFGGSTLEDNSELNGLTLGAVSKNTIIEFVEIFSNSDDSIEFFGGDVNTRFILSAFSKDDSFDWDTGFSGRGQFWASIGNTNGAGSSDHGGELDGINFNGDNVVPELRGLGTVYNATFVGPGSASGVDEGAFEFSDDAGVRFYNSIFMEFGSHAIDIKSDAEDGVTEMADGKPRIDLTNNIFYGFGAGDAPSDLSNTATGEVLFSDTARMNEVENPGLRGISRAADGGLDLRPSLGSNATTNALADADDDWYLNVGYQGAFSPTTNWAMGWTYTSQKGYFPEANGPAASSAINLSVNTDIKEGKAFSPGFVIDGELPKGVLIRAVGPELAQFGLTPMADPQFTVFNGNSEEIASSDDWNAGSDKDLLELLTAANGALALGEDGKSAATYVVLNPGAYTVQVSDVNGGGGRVVVEVFDIDR